MKVIDLGLCHYQVAYQTQLEILKNVIDGDEDALIVCSHFPVVTLGRKSSPSDISGWPGEIISIERGGMATYHGPEQIVIYPIINLKRKGLDITQFLDRMELATVYLLNDLGLKAQGNPERGNPNLTGVWIQGFKIASIGIALKHWVSYHGIALNVNHDPQAFIGINPCGKDATIMTNIEALLDQKQDLEQIKSLYLQSMKSVFETEIQLTI